MPHVFKPVDPNNPDEPFVAGALRSDYRPTEDEIAAAYERLAAARLQLMSRLPFMGSLMARMRFVIAAPEHRVLSACVTPDFSMYWNYGFLQACSKAMIMGVMCHEVMHPIYKFWARLGRRDPKRFSRAQDYNINLDVLDLAASSNLSQIEFALPNGVLIDEKYRGMTSEQIYDLLEVEELKQKGRGRGQGQGQGQGGGEGQGGQGGQGDGLEDSLFDCREDLSATKEGKEAAKGVRSAQKYLQEKWEQAILVAKQQHEASVRTHRGTLPLGIQQVIKEILEPKVSWTEVLSRWIGENGPRKDYNYRRPSRRGLAIDAILPSVQRSGTDDVIVLWDSSGSMGGREKEILGEISGMCEDLGLSLRLIVCDAAVHADIRNLTTVEEAAEAFAGGGGSDFIPAFALLDQEGATGVVLAFTDGMIGVPETKPPTLQDVVWVLWKSRYDRDPTEGKWGCVLHVYEDGNAVFGS